MRVASVEDEIEAVMGECLTAHPIGNPGSVTGSPAKNQNGFIKATGCATGIPLELIDSSKAGPAAGEQPLRCANRREMR